MKLHIRGRYYQVKVSDGRVHLVPYFECEGAYGATPEHAYWHAIYKKQTNHWPAVARANFFGDGIKPYGQTRRGDEHYRCSCGRCAAAASIRGAVTWEELHP